MLASGTSIWLLQSNGHNWWRMYYHPRDLRCLWRSRGYVPDALLLGWVKCAYDCQHVFPGPELHRLKVQALHPSDKVGTSSRWGLIDRPLGIAIAWTRCHCTRDVRMTPFRSR
jgi:hypothetical protein